METLKDLRFGEYLRYVFAGGITLFVWAVLYPKSLDSSLFDGAFSQGIVIFGLSLIIGSLIYSIHRATLCVVIHRVIACIAYRNCKIDMVDLNISRWKSLSEEKSLRHHISKWSPHVHFLYCASWGIFATLIIGKYFSATPAPKDKYLGFMIFAFVVLFAAIVDDYRATRYEKKLLEMEN